MTVRGVALERGEMKGECHEASQPGGGTDTFRGVPGVLTLSISE